jgi:hypothetical protein
VRFRLPKRLRRILALIRTNKKLRRERDGAYAHFQRLADENLSLKRQLANHARRDLARGEDIADGRSVSPEADAEIRQLREKVAEQKGIIDQLRRKTQPRAGAPQSSYARARAVTVRDLNHKVATPAEKTNKHFELNGRISREDNTKIEWILAGQLQTIPVPEDLADIKSWVDKYLANRVVLHNRAVAGAKKSVFQEIHLVYAALLALGDYRDCLISGDAKAKERLKRTLDHMHMKIKGSVSPIWAGREREAYRVNYEGRNSFLNQSLKYRGGHKPERMMRIYFFYNKNTKEVVVGSMTAHLDNSLT